MIYFYIFNIKFHETLSQRGHGCGFRRCRKQGRGCSQERLSCCGVWAMDIMVIRSLLGAVLSVKGSVADNIISAGVWASSIYTQQQPKQEGDDREMAADRSFPSSMSMVGAIRRSKPSPGLQGRAITKPQGISRAAVVRRNDRACLSTYLQGFYEHTVASLCVLPPYGEVKSQSILQMGQQRFKNLSSYVGCCAAQAVRRSLKCQFPNAYAALAVLRSRNQSFIMPKPTPEPYPQLR